MGDTGAPESAVQGGTVCLVSFVVGGSRLGHGEIRNFRAARGWPVRD